jgi:hypothetical protein
LYEYYVHDKLSAGGSFRMRKLNKAKPITNQIETLKIPQKPIMEFETVKCDGTQNDYYCRPKSKTFPAVDSWVHSVGFFQITVGEAHPVDQEICRFLQNYKDNKKVIRFLLYFN